MNSKNKLKPIPKFRTALKEAEFWDSHDLTEYFDFSRAKWGRFVLEKPKKKSLTVRLPDDLINQIKGAASHLGMSVSSLARVSFVEKLASL